MNGNRVLNVEIVEGMLHRLTRYDTEHYTCAVSFSVSRKAQRENLREKDSARKPLLEVAPTTSNIFFVTVNFGL